MLLSYIMCALKIKNFKISLLTNIGFYPCNRKFKHNNNILAFKIYSTNPYLINITGLKSFEDIRQIKIFLQTKLVSPSLPLPFFYLKVLKSNLDSMFASRRLETNLCFDIVQVAHFCKHHCKKYYEVVFDDEQTCKCLLAPKVNLKKNKCQKRLRPPQITLFHTGAVTVMGLKTLSQLDQVNRLIQPIFKHEFAKGKQQNNKIRK